MKILHIVPEFEEGGVERYVIQLCHEQIKHGHEITLATHGGKLEKFLPSDVKILHLPVHRKNLFTILYCVKKLSEIKNWDIINAHSRVPAWVAWKVSNITKIKWIMTAHANYSLNFGIKPLIHADGVICVSESVKEHLQNYLPENTIIIQNGIKTPNFKYNDFPHDKMKFLIIGRLTRLKGLDTALKALGKLKNYEWTLDIVGDGSQREELESLVKELGIDNRIQFYGFRDDTDKFMSEASCLLFPSRSEGFGLVVAEALAVGLPVLASDLEPLREFSKGKLIPPDNVEEWKIAIENVILGKPASPLSLENIISFEETARRVEKFYENIALR